MKRGKADAPFHWRKKYLHSLIAVLFLCLMFMSVEVPELFRPTLVYPVSTQLKNEWNLRIGSEVEWRRKGIVELENLTEVAADPTTQEPKATGNIVSTIEEQDERERTSVKRNFQGRRNARLLLKKSPIAENSEQTVHQVYLLNATDPSTTNTSDEQEPSEEIKLPRRVGKKNLSLRKAAQLAWKTGREAWREVEMAMAFSNESLWLGNDSRTEPCRESTSMTEKQLLQAGRLMPLPCGLNVGSSITVVGTPRPAHREVNTTIRRSGLEGVTEVSQFMLELHASREVKQEEPYRVLHVNPRLKGDWSNKQVIEQNTFHKGVWGLSQRCDGSRSSYREETVDGLVKCEKWLQDDLKEEEAKASQWLHRLVGRLEGNINWRYPFYEGRLFVLTIRAGWEGYHMSVDGRHVTSFPYRTGLLDEEITRVFVGGDVDVQSIIATSLPSSHPELLNQELIEGSDLWRAPELPRKSIELFIGIISASNHFAERMAVRKTWMQSQSTKNFDVVARFFVALHHNKDINLQIKREADYYRDMVILPFVDHYDLVVLKTIAICEYGVRNVSTKFIMKCDDDTFIRVEAVLNELKTAGPAEVLYLGNINLLHGPLRTGKWAVTFEEWPDEFYPPYANGPGYIISQNIANYIATQNKRRTLELFKMEDVSMGLWVKQFNTTKAVKYVHSWKFFQAGCENGYITAHYQSPRQILCLWNKLLKGEVQCCNIQS